MNVKINRLVLQFLSDSPGIPQDAGEIAAYVQTRIGRPCRAETVQSLGILESAGFVEKPDGLADAEPVFKATANGIRQATRRVKVSELDPLIWEQ